MGDFNEDSDALEAIAGHSARIVNPGSIEALFPPEFMKGRTDFDSLEAFLIKAPSAMDFPDRDITRPPAGWDTYVSEHTSFKGWAEMVNAAKLFLIEGRKRGEIPLGHLTPPGEFDAM